MKRCGFLLLGLICMAHLGHAKPVATKPLAARCGGPVKPPADKTDKADKDDTKPPGFVPEEVWSDASVTVGQENIAYCAAAGTLVVHPKDWDDAAPPPDSGGKGDQATGDKNLPAQASMFYVAYFKRDVAASARPITFLFNGGPGSASVWLHMGAFGPRRVDTADATHAPAAPYRLVNNEQSLLDVSDLVFIDAPGTGFSRIMGDDKETAFYGVDEDAHAFARFIADFLSKYKRWNSPKYLFGESYGTARAAVLAAKLQSEPGVDFNGIVMLSQVLASGFFPDRPEATPGNDLPYQLGLPTYAATSWYHNQPRDAPPGDVPLALMSEVERFAMGDYAAALAAGATLDPARREEIVTKLHDYTGLTADYLRRADLRVSADQFRQELLHDRGLIIGDTDTRYRGHTLDRMGKKAGYDPTDAAITSAYISSFNDYTRRVLGYGEGKTYRPEVKDIADQWRFAHEQPNGADSGQIMDSTLNVMPDLAQAMKYNPLLKVQLNAGYFDLLTPWLQGKYEMTHLPVPAELRGNIEYRCYQAGHMVYLRPDARVQLHDNVADFIDRTANLPRRAVGARIGPAGCPGAP